MDFMLSVLYYITCNDAGFRFQSTAGQGYGTVSVNIGTLPLGTQSDRSQLKFYSSNLDCTNKVKVSCLNFTLTQEMYDSVIITVPPTCDIGIPSGTKIMNYFDDYTVGSVYFYPQIFNATPVNGSQATGIINDSMCNFLMDYPVQQVSGNAIINCSSLGNMWAPTYMLAYWNNSMDNYLPFIINTCFYTPNQAECEAACGGSCISKQIQGHTIGYTACGAANNLTIPTGVYYFCAPKSSPSSSNMTLLLEIGFGVGIPAIIIIIGIVACCCKKVKAPAKMPSTVVGMRQVIDLPVVASQFAAPAAAQI